MINYLCTSPMPRVEGTDAVYNEIATLKSHFSGNVETLYPFRTPSSRYPAMMLGLHKIGKLKSHENQSEINHIYGAGLYRMPAINHLKKPTIYSLVAGISSQRDLPSNNYLNKFEAIVVSNERDYALLKEYGVDRVNLIRTSIDVDHFDKQTLPLDDNLHLIMASAPWESKQFESKGIHIILSALQSMRNVHMTFLWRDILPEVMRKLITMYGVEDKVTLVNNHVDVNTYLSKAHGAILLANDTRVIKAYPHSLLESLCAGKPVLLTRDIPLSDFVKKHNCGLVLNEFSSEGVLNAIAKFKSEYRTLAKNAYNIPKETFSKERFIEQHQDLYQKVMAKKSK